MARARTSAATREAILEAATRVASREGISAMTLENVALEAGVSKGGLLHHFRGKEILISSMIEHFAKSVRSALVERVARDPSPRGRWVRAFVDLVLPRPVPESADAEAVPVPGVDLALASMNNFHTSVLAALVENPELVAPIRNMGFEIRRRIVAEGDPEQLISWLAIDGLLLWKLFGFIGPEDPDFESIAEALRARVRPRESPTEDET
ncbi:MAG: TetR family transcriptional regulator [Isosphaeraceae bacterium]|nr:TetR family transcriptional regulator [Isosphaeraceae bacterium]